MALGAGRTELNIEISGESDIADAMRKAREEIAALEARIRALTRANDDNTDSTDRSESGLNRFNDLLGGLSGGVEDAVGGIEKAFGAIGKVTGVIGNISEMIQGAIAAYKFLTEESAEVKAAQEKMSKELEEVEKQAAKTRAEIEKLAEAQKKASSEIRSETVSMTEERLKLARLRGDEGAAIFLQSQLEHEKEVARVEELKVKFEELKEKRTEVMLVEAEANSNLIQAEKTIKQLIEDREKTEKRLAEAKQGAADVAEIDQALSRAFYKDAEKAEFRLKQIKHDIYVLTKQTLEPKTARADQAKKTREELDRQKSTLGGMLGLAQQVADAVGSLVGFQGPQKTEAEKVTPKGGGGGKSKAERDREALEKAEAEALQQALRMVAAEEGITKLLEREGLVREAVRDEAKLFEGLARQRVDVLMRLDSIPKDLAGGASKAFEPFALALKKQLAEIDKVMSTRVEFDMEIASPEEEDALLKALENQKTAYDKLNESIGANIGMQEQAIEASKKLLESYERGLPAEKLKNFEDGLKQLQAMSVPAFGEIGNVVGQVAEQFDRYKAGQTSMTNATIQGSSAIAGAIAKQIGGVKAEAAVRAIFETAMGFATIANPVESAGHFTAATMFGLVAGGVLKSGASGGQKAPETKTASTTSTGGGGGGGGPITNVYNLQTGIVDGQSTARAFRQAEQSARNTGMASAGGW
jgi:hypothetical protein